MTKTLGQDKLQSAKQPGGGDGGTVPDQSREQDSSAPIVLQELDETAQNEPKSSLAMTEVFYPSTHRLDLADKLGEKILNFGKAAVTNRDHPIDNPADPIDANFESIVKDAI